MFAALSSLIAWKPQETEISLTREEPAGARYGVLRVDVGAF